MDHKSKSNKIPNQPETMEIEEKGQRNEHVAFTERIRRFLCFFTVEPFLLCYFLSNTLSSTSLYRMNLEKACRVDLNYTEVICNMVIHGEKNNNITLKASNAASEMVADMTAWQYPLQFSLPLILILFVGAWSDKTGNRKILMLLPVLGEIVSISGMILTTFYFNEWPLYVTGLIEALPTAISGGTSIALLGSISYLADITTLDSRTFRIGLVDIIVSLGIPIGTSLSGVLAEYIGYYGVFGIALVLYIIGFLHTLFFVHNLRDDKDEGNFSVRFISFFHPRNVWDTISIIFLSRKRQRIQIILIIIVYIVILGPVHGEGAIFYQYAKIIYGMDDVYYSLFQTFSTVIPIIGTSIAITVFSKLLKMHDSFIGIIGTACKTISSFVYGIAPTKSWLFCGPAFDIFGNSSIMAIRSLVTKAVDPEYVGKMCSLIGLLDAFIPTVYPPLYSKVYSKTVGTMPGVVYYLGTVMTTPAFFIFIILFVMSKKDERDAVKDPVTKEMHAYENDVTAL